MNKYRAAAIVFYKNETIEGKVFMGLESKGWMHFGGKIEEQDGKDSSKTMLRELMEETEGQITVDDASALEKIYDQKSKMVVYFKNCDEELQEKLKDLKPTKVKSKYKWMEINDPGIPKYIRIQLSRPKIAIVVDSTIYPELCGFFVAGLRNFYFEYSEVCNTQDQYFLSKIVHKEEKEIIPLINKYLKLNGNHNMKNVGQFMDLFTINKFTVRSLFNRINFQLDVDQLFQTE